MMDIDHNAPLHAEASIQIDAPLEKIWALQSNIDGWPQWQPDITSAKMEGALKPGTVFRWKGGGLNITSKLHTVEPPKQIGWTGDAIGMHAVHNWTFEPSEGGTLVTSRESISGWLARLLKLFDRNFLNKSLTKSLENFKAHAEMQVQAK